MEKKLQNIALVIFVIICFTPAFYLKYTVFPFIVAKTLLFRLLICLLAINWTALVAINPQKYLSIFNKKNYILWSLIAYGVISTISGILGIEPAQSFFSSNERMLGLVSLYSFILLYIFITSIIKSKKNFHTILNSFLVCNVLVGIHALFSYAGLTIFSNLKGQRFSGLIGSPSFLSVYAVFGIFVALYFWALEYKEQSKIFTKYLFGALFLFFILLGTGTRATIVAAGLAIFILLIYFIASKPKSLLKKISLSIVCLSLVSLGAIIAFKDTEFVQSRVYLQRLTTINTQERTFQNRMVAAKVAQKALENKTILGWGYETFQYAYLRNFDPLMLKVTPDDRLYDKPHNAILEASTNTGALGLITYLAIYSSIFYTAYISFKKNNINKDILVIFWLAYIAHFVSNIFLFDTFETYLGFFLLMGFIGAINHFTEKEEYSNNFNKKIILLAIPVIIASGWFVYEHGYKNIVNSYYGAKAIDSFQKGSFDDGYYNVLKLTEHPADTSRDVIITSSSIFFDNNYKMKVTHEQDVMMSNLYIKEIDRLLEIYPENLLLKAIQARFLALKEGEESLKRGLQIINEAIEESPHYVDFLSMRSAIYVIQKDFDNALHDLDIILDFTDYFPDPYYKKSYIYLSLKDYHKSLDNYILGVKANFGYNSEYNKKLADVARALHREDDYIQPYLDLCQEDPSNMQYFANLASAYAHLGNKAKVLEVTDMILKADKRYQKVVDDFLKQINYK